MRREDLSFLERAPVRHDFAAVLAAPRPDVFAAIADPTSWSSWFPGVRSARYRGVPPYGVGTIREADVSGTRWIEEMIAWDADRRWTYTVIESSTPLAAAQVESFELDETPGGTRVRWTLAIEPRLMQRLSGPIAPLVMGRLFARAMRNLEARLAGTAPPVAGWIDIDRWMTRSNPLVIGLLRSPLHVVLGGGLMLLTITGRRSGRRYTIPVGYQRDGDVLRVLVSKARRKQWWRNFRVPAPVEVELHGERLQGTARVVDATSQPFRDVVAATLQRLPMLGAQLGIAVERGRGLSDQQLEVVSREAALVEITLATPPAP
jgi:deazaflavin-dependent oxidoreductase (nitroreductase family)